MEYVFAIAVLLRAHLSHCEATLSCVPMVEPRNCKHLLVHWICSKKVVFAVRDVCKPWVLEEFSFSPEATSNCWSVENTCVTDNMFATVMVISST